MKTSILILITFLFVGCEIAFQHEYVVENKTPHKVKIEGFDRISDPYDSEVADETINIEPNSSYSVFKEAGYEFEDQGIFNSFQFDSVNIIFNNEKIIVQYCEKSLLFTCDDIEHNIMGIESNEYERVKTGRSDGEKEYRYTYTITEEDYNNALPIED